MANSHIVTYSWRYLPTARGQLCRLDENAVLYVGVPPYRDWCTVSCKQTWLGSLLGSNPNTNGQESALSHRPVCPNYELQVHQFWTCKANGMHVIPNSLLFLEVTLCKQRHHSRNNFVLPNSFYCWLSEEDVRGGLLKKVCSPLRTAPYHTFAFSAILTSPTNVALGATNAPSATTGFRVCRFWSVLCRQTTANNHARTLHEIAPISYVYLIITSWRSYSQTR